MKITNDLKLYLDQTTTIVNSEIIVTDLEKVLFTCFKHSDDSLLNKPLSQDMIELYDMWKNQQSYNDNFLMLNKDFKKITNEDDFIEYSAQMIFPIYHNNSIDGFIIFFRTFGNYIETSSKAPISARQFIEKFSDDNYIGKD